VWFGRFKNPKGPIILRKGRVSKEWLLWGKERRILGVKVKLKDKNWGPVPIFFFQQDFYLGKKGLKGRLIKLLGSFKFTEFSLIS